MTMTPDTPAGGAVLVIDMCPHLRTTVSVGPTTDQRNHYCPDCRSSWVTHPERLAIHPPATVPADAVLALVGKWREYADWLNSRAELSFAQLCTRDAIRDAADELEALTRGGK